jgi:hypothetical protein
VISEILHEHQIGKVDHGKRIWALAALAIWAEEYEI